MILPDPNVIGYVLERLSQTVDGEWHIVCDAAPAHLVAQSRVHMQRVRRDEFYRVAGQVYGTVEPAVAAWVPRGVANI